MLKFIDIKRKSPNCEPDKSSLQIEDNKLIVLGVLPHGTEITLTEKNAQKLYEWLNDNFELDF